MLDVGLLLGAMAVGLSLCAPPGAVTARALQRGLEGGFKPALYVELGSLVGDASWAALALTGLAVLFREPDRARPSRCRGGAAAALAGRELAAHGGAAGPGRACGGGRGGW